jgi:hypothetical protein
MSCIVTEATRPRARKRINSLRSIAIEDMAAPRADQCAGSSARLHAAPSEGAPARYPLRPNLYPTASGALAQTGIVKPRHDIATATCPGFLSGHKIAGDYILG